MAARPRDTPKVPITIERLLRQLVVTMKAVLLYPGASSIPRENAAQVALMLGRILQDRPEVRLAVQKGGLTYEGLTIFEGQSAFESFAQELYNRRLAEVRFHSGVVAADVLTFLEALTIPAAKLLSAGGVESHLWEHGVDTITVTEASARVVDAGLPGDPGDETEPWPPAPTRIDEILQAALGGRPRDQRMLVRVTGDAGAMSAYLMETLTGRGKDARDMLSELKLDQLAHAAMKEPRDARPALFRAIAQAVQDLTPELKRLVVSEKLLPDARKDDALASVVRQMDIDDICRVLVESLTEDSGAIDGLARAIRNLALISLADREQVIDSAGAAMQAAGLSQDVIGAVFETVSPSRLQVRDRASDSGDDQPIDSILKLVDLAPGAMGGGTEGDLEVAALQEESQRGLTDGDVVGALATLISVDSASVNFESMMALLEDSIGLLVQSGEYTVAADVAESLATTLENRQLPPERRMRVEAALACLGQKAELALISKAMRNFEPGTPEHDGCSRLLAVLGEAVIQPLLEVMADEPDMTARKALVELLSDMSDRYVEQFAAHVTDPRWFFVRNVVAILGSARRSGALPALGRTLRHSDPRVRRETIRALARIQDRLAAEMLTAALDDGDAQNVALAARYLGALNIRGAAAALEQVAKGEGRGNRETGPRAEAIESLGRIGSAESLPLLESFAGRRPLLGRATAKELKVAAERAIDAIRSQGGTR